MRGRAWTGWCSHTFARAVFVLDNNRPPSAQKRPDLVDVLGDVVHEMGESVALQKDGVERDLEDALAAGPAALGEELTLVKSDHALIEVLASDSQGIARKSRDNRGASLGVKPNPSCT